MENVTSNSSMPMGNGNGKSLQEIISKQQEHFKRIGRIGELFVLEKERIKLAGTRYAALVRDLTDDPDTHYDILSFTVDGEEIYIEVKSTTSTNPHSKFYMSQDEIDIAWNYWVNDCDYQIHRVFAVGGKIDRFIFTSAWLFREYDFIGKTFEVRRKVAA